MVDNQQAREVSGFSQAWLTLREAADHAARSQELNDALIAWAHPKTPLRVMDFGTGTGSNLRYLCPLLGHDQHWTLVDNDSQLLSQLPDILLCWAASNGMAAQHQTDSIILSNDAFSACVQWRQSDLVHALQSLPFQATDLVTGSALLDLTSPHWLDQLARLCIEHQCASLFVLSYDGRIHWQPVTHQDALMRQRLNTHQLNDKGFGDALGPQAGQYLAGQLQTHQQVTVVPSDWLLSGEHQNLQAALIEGWTAAAIEQDPPEQAAIEQWRNTRDKHNNQLQSTLTVGHTDVLALPIAVV